MKSEIFVIKIKSKGIYMPEKRELVSLIAGHFKIDDITVTKSTYHDCDWWMGGCMKEVNK